MHVIIWYLITCSAFVKGQNILVAKTIHVDFFTQGAYVSCSIPSVYLSKGLNYYEIAGLANDFTVNTATFHFAAAANITNAQIRIDSISYKTDPFFKSIEKSLFQNSLGEFLAKTRKAIGEDPIVFIQNQKNFDDMLTEFFVFFRDPNNINSVTKNQKAFSMAKEFFDAKYKMFERRKQAGDNNI